MKFLYLLFFLLSFYFLSAQSEQSNGTLTLKTGVQITGEIDFDDYYNTPEKVRILKGDKYISYTPEEIAEVDLGSRKYISRYVAIDRTDQDLQMLSSKINQKTVHKNIFLRVKVSGNASLYSYKDSRNHFFILKDTTFVELLKIKRSAGNGKLSAYNKYLGQLSLLLSDCLDIKQINGTSFTLKQIQKRIVEYNQCKDQGSDYIEEKVPLKLGVYLVGGYKFSSYEVRKGLEGEEFDRTSAKTGSPTFGVAMDFNLFKTSRKWQLYNELLYQSYVFEVITTDTRFAEFYIDYTSKMDVAYLELTNSIRYNFQAEKRNFNPFIGLNLTNGFKVKDESTEDIIVNFFDNQNTIPQEPFDGRIKSYRTTVSISLGVTLKNFNLEGRYGFRPRLSDYPTISKSENILLIASYKFL